MRALHRSCFTVGLFLGLAASGRAVTLEQIPSPRPAGWAVDLTATLPAETLAELNRLGDQVKAESGAELAVAVVGTIDGAEPREFATRLFNAWGLGERGKDNGLLVFAALDDRAVEIVLGDGLDADAGRRESEVVMHLEMLPRFREGNPAGAILQGARACARRILGVAISEAVAASPAPPWTPGEPIAASPPETSDPISPRAPVAREGFNPGLFGVVGPGIGLLAIAAFLAYPWIPARCRRCRLWMRKLDEAADDEHLENSELIEERIDSVDYQIWVCPGCGERSKRRILRISSYQNCPECRARTLRSTSATVSEATYDHGGLIQYDYRCLSCSYSNSYTRSTPMLRRPVYDVEDHRHSYGDDDDRSSYSGGGSSSSSSSSGSGSDFGGGHSSGGGASGRW